jgi:branched-chain amino acid transport system ATP-binding protein
MSTTPERPPVQLAVDDLHATYGGSVVALQGVSVAVGQGETVAVLGANGAGKTTLVRSVTGLLASHGGKVDSGEISYDGQTITGWAANKTVARGIGQIPEGRKLFAGLTVEENLRSGAMGKPRSAVAEDLARIYEVLPRLQERRQQKAGFLSGGEQQMVAIGRALMGSPRLLLSDELSLGLAPIITRELYELLAELTRTLGLSWLIIEQNAALALEYSSYVYVLESGSLVGEGASTNLEDTVDLGAIYLGR